MRKYENENHDGLVSHPEWRDAEPNPQPLQTLTCPPSTELMDAAQGVYDDDDVNDVIDDDVIDGFCWWK